MGEPTETQARGKWPEISGAPWTRPSSPPPAGRQVGIPTSPLCIHRYRGHHVWVLGAPCPGAQQTPNVIPSQPHDPSEQETAVLSHKTARNLPKPHMGQWQPRVPGAPGSLPRRRQGRGWAHRLSIPTYVQSLQAHCPRGHQQRTVGLKSPLPVPLDRPERDPEKQRQADGAPST